MSALPASSSAGAIASDVLTMHPSMMRSPSDRASAIACMAPVSPPVLSSLMLTAS